MALDGDLTSWNSAVGVEFRLHDRTGRSRHAPMIHNIDADIRWRGVIDLKWAPFSDTSEVRHAPLGRRRIAALPDSP
jgi:hypothetical protein